MTFYSHKIASFVCLFYLIGGSSSWAADPTVAAKVISEAGARATRSVPPLIPADPKRPVSKKGLAALPGPSLGRTASPNQSRAYATLMCLCTWW